MWNQSSRERRGLEMWMWKVLVEVMVNFTSVIWWVCMARRPQLLKLYSVVSLTKCNLVLTANA